MKCIHSPQLPTSFGVVGYGMYDGAINKYIGSPVITCKYLCSHCYFTILACIRIRIRIKNNFHSL